MNRLVVTVITVSLIIITLLVFVYPNTMVAPGKLVPAHQSLNSDCLACHTPLFGASS